VLGPVCFNLNNIIPIKSNLVAYLQVPGTSQGNDNESYKTEEHGETSHDPTSQFDDISQGDQQDHVMAEAVLSSSHSRDDVKQVRH